MSACMNKKIQDEGLSKSMRIDEETMLMQKQGIVTILGSHSKVTSDSSSSSEGAEDERERERFQIWNSVQLDKKEKNENPGQFDIWSSILTQKANDEASKLSAPYIHPLVKRSKSCLSEKSLEICTESLGSETGSDGFSSETGDSEEEDEEELKVPKYNYSLKKSLKRCFPPPIPSLSLQHGGPSLHMRPHRDNGRLFLQAVSVPSQNNFLAQRQDGRLVLTFAREDEEEEEDEKDDVEELKEEEDESVIEKALMMNKPIGLVNKSLKWLENFNEVPRARMVLSTQGVFNAYDYYSLLKNNIRSKVVVSGNLNINQISNETQQLLVLRGKNGDYLIHNFKSCKDSKRDFLFWEPYCIAT